MLAERKKKVKWTINPRGNSWSKDTNKFGQRMLEKMGWRSGEGLGANKQGITEHIKVAYKNDNKCLGYKDNGEEWVEHQSQFESLLAELSSSHTTAATLDLVKDNISQNESLEERSRHSRTRVHYQKFTRGKDLSKYSEKDLKCIILVKQKANSTDGENEDSGGNEYSNEFYGVKTINSGNMNDYFEKLTSSQNYSDTYSSAVKFGEVDMREKNNDVGEQCDVKVKKKKKRKEDTCSSAVQLGEVEMIEENNDVEEQCDVKVKKKKKRKEDTCSSTVQLEVENIEENNDVEEQCDVKVKKKKKRKYSCSSAVQLAEVEMIEENNDVEEECDVKVKKKRKRKAEVQVSDAGNSNTDSNEASSIKQHENKRKKCEVLENSVNDQLYTDCENRSVSESKLQRHDITDLDGILINGICIEKLHCGELCKEKRLKKQINSSIQDRENELMEVDDEIEDKQVKIKSKKKNSELVNEGNETSLVSVEVLSKSENSKSVEHFTFGADDEREVRQAKKSKKNKPVSSSEEETSLVPVESVLRESQSVKDSRLHLTVELDEIEGKQKKKTYKKKKPELTGDFGETSVNTTEDVSQRLENSKDTEIHLSVEGKQLKKKSKKNKNDLLSESREISILLAEDVSCRLENSKDTEQHLADEVSDETEGKQLKKKSKKNKNDLLSHSGEISILPAEDVSYRLENSKDTEQHFADEVTDETEGKQLKKKSKKKRHVLLSEGEGASVVPIQDISQMSDISENIAEHLMGKDEKLAKDTFIVCEDNHKIAHINKFDNGASSDNEVRSNEQTAEDVMPTKRKKKKNTKIDSEKTVTEDIPKYVNDICVDKRKHKRKKDENEINRQSEQAEPVMEEDKKTNTDEELQNVANSMHSNLQSTVNKNVGEELNEGCLESPAKSHESYSVDEIKNMKLSLFTQLIDPRLIEFKGSNLHKIAGYGKL